MSFSIDLSRRPPPIMYETEDLRLHVGTIFRGRKGEYEFHFEPVASALKDHKHRELALYGRQQAELLAVTQRLIA